ncbi:MAG: hypothetical protein P4M00_24215 [Azospirillaceae bacterium]|nr:hypothetical protein [Azospirillaceae bacterium]
MKLEGLRRRAGTLVLGLVAGTMMVAPAAAAGVPDGAGFTAVVLGISSAGDEKIVIDALPVPLTDRSVNFTHDSTFRAAVHYRMILVFHAQDRFDGTPLCAQDVPGKGLDITPPAFNDMMKTTHLTGVFCADRQTLMMATSRMVGSVTPGDAGFRFLVADVAKQLFPDGFAVLPRHTDSDSGSPG